jgi:transcriptional regulator GlxA family with amidase domain
LHPAWLARAYRAWRGEGLADTVRRRRVERGALLLRMSDTPLAEVAVACGFCDQSHMNRSFRAVLGRTPLDVRSEASLLAPLAPA